MQIFFYDDILKYFQGCYLCLQVWIQMGGTYWFPALHIFSKKI